MYRRHDADEVTLLGIIIMPTQSEIDFMLVELSELLADCGIPTMKGNRITNFTTKLVIINAYVGDAQQIIDEGGHPATIESLGQGISIIKAVY